MNPNTLFIVKKRKRECVETDGHWSWESDSPYHLASSSLAGDTAAGFFFGGGGAAFFLEKSATVLKVTGVDGDGADLVAPLRLTGFPSISDIAAVEAAREAMFSKGENEEEDTICMVWWMCTCHVGFMILSSHWFACNNV